MSTTETASTRFSTIENWSSADMVDGMIEGQFVAVSSVHAIREKLSEAIDLAAERLERGGRLIYMGAGTSGRIATQDAAELLPTFNWPTHRAISLMAGGTAAFVAAVENAEDNEEQAILALQSVNVTANDVVIGIAASGRTPYTISGLSYAREHGALTIGIYNNKGGRIGEVCDLPILIETGAEFLAGSTRLKAGTAQKVALNVLSTGVMIKLGFVYRGLMVEMLATNEKLVDRSIKMIATLTDTPYEAAQVAWVASGESIKIATVMLTKNLSAEAATALIEAGNGNLRRALLAK